MYTFAQTNLQLFQQLKSAGYQEVDLICIHKAYQLASQVFTGFFRGSAKPFICHLVGTASILAFVQAPIEIVAAGLLHAVYELGDFGDGSRGISESKRHRVIQVVGKKIATYIEEYTNLRWQNQTIVTIHGNLERLTHLHKDVLLIRLANELEDHLDSGVLYCRNIEKRLDYLNSCGYLMIEIATRLGYPQLATELDSVFQATLSSEVTTALQSTSDYSYLLPTSSLLKRFIGQWRYRLGHLFKKIMRVSPMFTFFK